MNKILASLSVLPLLLFIAAPAYASQLCPQGFTSLCKLKLENTGGIINTIVSLMLIIAIAASLIYLIFGAIRWMTSGGEEAKVKAARGAIVAAIIGLVISLLAFFIVNVLLTIFTGQGFSGLSMPKLVQ